MVSNPQKRNEYGLSYLIFGRIITPSETRTDTGRKNMKTVRIRTIFHTYLLGGARKDNKEG